MASPSTEHALTAVAAVGERLGLAGPIEPTIVREGFNLTIRLNPHPIVARVATATAELRDVATFQHREVAVLGHLERAQAPAVRLASVGDGPYDHDGWRMILMRFHDNDPDRIMTPTEFSTSLRALHDGLSSLEIDLPSFVESLLEVPLLLKRAADAISVVDRDFLCTRAEAVSAALADDDGATQALHGDVHLGNVLRTPDGPIWADLEDACTGPIEWDLASLLASTQINTTHRELVEAALLDYDVDQNSRRWRACLEGNMLMFTAWAALGALSHERMASTLPARMRWHRQYSANL